MQGLMTVNRESYIDYREIGNDTENRLTIVLRDAGRGRETTDVENVKGCVTTIHLTPIL
jgi:hypothetical protein